MHQQVSVQMVKNHLLAICHGFKMFVKNNHLLIRMTMVFNSEKYSAFQLAEVHQVQQREVFMTHRFVLTVTLL